MSFDKIKGVIFPMKKIADGIVSITAFVAGVVVTYAVLVLMVNLGIITI